MKSLFASCLSNKLATRLLNGRREKRHLRALSNQLFQAFCCLIFYHHSRPSKLGVVLGSSWLLHIHKSVSYIYIYVHIFTLFLFILPFFDAFFLTLFLLFYALFIVVVVFEFNLNFNVNARCKLRGPWRWQRQENCILWWLAIVWQHR